MVAFGHYLEHLKTLKPEWASKFLNYGNLKTLIARIRELSGAEYDYAPDSDDEAPFVCYDQIDLRIYKGREAATLDEIRDQFKIAVTYEVDKAAEFHSRLLEHFKESLEKQTDDFWHGSSGHGNSLTSGSEVEASNSRGVTFASNPKYWQNKQLCESLYQEVSMLKHFSGTHRIAIRKIIKKFNKEMKRAGYKQESGVDPADFLYRYNTKAQDPHGGGYSNFILETIEGTYAEFHACEDITDARRRLKQSISHSGHGAPPDVFLMGILVGTLIPICCFLVYLFVVEPDAVALTTFWAILPLYRALALLNIGMWAWALDLYLFSRCYLNHTYILGLNPEKQLRWTTMVNYSAALSVIMCCNLGIHFILFDIVHFHFTVVVLLLVAVCLVIPLPILEWDTRKSTLRAIWRCMFEVPAKLLFYKNEDLVTIQFRDFFLADQLVSASIFLGDLYYCGCFSFYVLTSSGSSVRGTSPGDLIAASECMQTNNAVKPFIICLPYIWRLCQCVIMMKVTKNRVHIANGVKYSLGLLVLVVGDLARRSQSDYFYIVWVMVTLSGQLYSWFWDFIMDWGWKLFDWNILWRTRRSHSRSTNMTPMLPAGAAFKTRRIHLPWLFHASCIPGDLIFRLLFFTTIDEGLSPFLPDPRLLSLCLGVIEIFRRCIWNVLRIENEQLHNLESYRPKTDEVPEPLNEIFGEEWVTNTRDAKDTRQRGVKNMSYSTFS